MSKASECVKVTVRSRPMNEKELNQSKIVTQECYSVANVDEKS
jgi:hypothetical protein